MKKVLNNKKEFIEIIRYLGQKYEHHRVFEDFLSLSVCAINNQYSGLFASLQRKEEKSIAYLANAIHFKKREEQYIEVFKKYNKDERTMLKDAFYLLVACLDFYAQEGQPHDVLGEIYHELELENVYKGQFFSHQSVSDLLAVPSIGDCETIIQQKGYVSVSDPCCGSGVMSLGYAKALNNKGYDYHANCCITCNDIDLKCCFMAYIQLALYGIPAVIIHGDSLTTKEWERWYTPTYILDNWIWRQRCGITTRFCQEDEYLRLMEPSWEIVRLMQKVTMGRHRHKFDESETEPLVELQHPAQLSLSMALDEVKEKRIKHITRLRI